MQNLHEPAGDDAFDAAVEDFLARRRRGESPDVEEHAARHPAFAGRLRELLPSILLLESAAGGDGTSEGSAPPERLGEFRLLREIGRGGMGVVYEAEQAPMGRRVALKILPPAYARDPMRLGRFRREAALAARLEHPAVCPVHAAGVTDGVAWIAMRFVEGTPLSVLIGASGAGASLTVRDAGGPASPAAPAASSAAGYGTASLAAPAPAAHPALPIPPRSRRETARVLEFFEEAARGLHAAHAVGVVHRDVKPGNLMVSPDGRPVILDFGLARDLEGDGEGLTETGERCGTPLYMAPEQVGGRPPEPRTDVWALGVSLHEALCGRRPFAAPTREALYRAILEDPPAPLRAANPVLPRDLAVVVATALAKEPDARYRTALDLAEDLRRVRALEPILARAPSLPVRLLRWARRSPGRAALVAALVLAMAAAIALTTLFVANIPRIRESERRQRLAEAEALVEEASLAHSWGALEEVDGLLDRALELESGLPEAWIGRILARLLESGADAALGAIGSARGLLGAPVSDRLTALVLRRSGRDAEAAALEAGFAEPASAVEWYVAGRLAMAECDVESQCDFDRAFTCFGRAIQFSDHARALHHFERAHAAGHTRDAAKIDEAAAPLRVLWPDSPRAKWWLADLHRAAGRHEAAIGLCREILAADPGDARALRLLGFIHQKRRDFPAAAEAYAAALRARPRNRSLALSLVAAERRAGRLEAAEERLAKLSATGPDDPSVLLELGLLRAARHRWTESEAALRRALELKPRHAFFRTTLANCLLAQGRVPEAVEEARRAVEADAADARTHKALAMALNDAEDLDGAAAAWEDALRVAPADPEALRESGLLSARRGDLDRGIERVRRALETGGDDAVVLGHLGAMLLKKEAWAEGLSVLESAAGLGSKDAGMWNDLGIARERTGDPEGAVESWREAERLAPGHFRPPFNIGTGLLGLGRYGEALEVLRRAADLAEAGSEDRRAVDRQIEAVERREAAARRFAERLEGRGVPFDAGDLLEMSRVCADRKRYREGLGLLDEALALAPPHPSGLRVEAARLALFAAGVDPEAPALRERARALLSEELAFLSGRYDDERIRPALVARTLESWLRDPAFAAVLSDAAWSSLWARVNDLLIRCQARN